MYNKRILLFMSILKWFLNLAILVYLLVLIFLFIFSGFEFGFLSIRIRAHSPSNPLIIVISLSFLRLLLSLEFKNAVLLIFSILFSLFFIEAILRFVDVRMAREPELKEWRQPSQDLGWEIIPNLEGTFVLGSSIKINSHGLRDVPYSLDKPQESYRILGIGDSFTFGYGVNLEDTYLKKLEAMFSKNGKSVEVINGGVIGYSFYQSLTFLRSKGIKFNPDLIIYFYYIDDLSAVNSDDDAKRSYNKLLQEQQKPYSILSKSYVYNFLHNSLVLLDFKFRSRTGADWIKGVEDREKYFYTRIEDYKIDEKKLKLLRELLFRLKETSTEIGADLIVVAIPDAAQFGIPEARNQYEILQNECANFEIPFLDITSVFEKQSDIGELYLFPMDAHTNVKGNSIIAEKLYDFIIDQIPFP